MQVIFVNNVLKYGIIIWELFLNKGGVIMRLNESILYKPTIIKFKNIKGKKYFGIIKFNT